jgi:predicted PurR-regulated permease PerM
MLVPADDAAATEPPRSGSEDEAAGARNAQRELSRGQPDTVKVCLVILTLLAVLAALTAAAAIVIPLVLALVLNLLLAPAKRLLIRLRLPSTVAALFLIIILFAVLGGVGVAISVPASQWIARAPEGIPKLQEQFGALRKPMAFLRKEFDQMHHALDQGTQPPERGVQRVAVQPTSDLGGLGLSVLQGTQVALGQFVMVAVVLFFLLAGGGSLLRRLVEIVPGFGDKRRVVTVAIEIESNISAYLFTITAMNLLVGVANGLQMWAQGLPDPLLWGTTAFLLNYVPIIGPMTGVVLFFFVGLFVSDGIWAAMLPPAIYLAIHVAEGQVVTPLLLARRFTLNPVLVIVSLFFCDWMWGVTGALLSVPLLSILKIICDHIPSLNPLGHLLGGPPEGGGISAQPARSGARG